MTTHNFDAVIDNARRFCAGLGIDVASHTFRRNAGDLNYWSVSTVVNGWRIDTPSMPQTGSGFDLDPAMAALTSFSEGVERLCLTNVLEENAIVVRDGALDGGFLTEEQWPTFTDWQLRAENFPFRSYQPSNVRYWTHVDEVRGHAKLTVPASLIWLIRFSDSFMPSVSSGASCHQARDQAIVNGILELVERDGFTIAWDTRAHLPRLDPYAHWQSDETRFIATEMAGRGIAVYLFDITTDLGLPIVLALFHDPCNRKPAFAIGAACRFTYASACAKAIREAYQTWTWMRDEFATRSVAFKEVWDRLQQPTSMFDHPFAFGFPDAEIYIRHLLDRDCTDPRYIEPVRSAARAPDQDDIGYLLSILGRLNLTPYYKTLTPTFLNETGLIAVKVLIPGLVPLGIGRWGKALGHPRYLEVPKAMGWDHTPISEQCELIPHPFP